jgi:hypothetical protein
VTLDLLTTMRRELSELRELVQAEGSKKRGFFGWLCQGNSDRRHVLSRVGGNHPEQKPEHRAECERVGGYGGE